MITEESESIKSQITAASKNELDKCKIQIKTDLSKIIEDKINLS